MLAFAAKLAGPLIALVAMAFPASKAVDQPPEHTFEENLDRYASSRSQVNPLTAQVNPLTAQVNPLTAQVTPLIAQVNPLSQGRPPMPLPRVPEVVRVPRPYVELNKREQLAAVGPQIDALMAAQPEAKLGVAVRWSNGETLYLRDANTPFPMASVAKVYMLVAYLDRLEREGRTPDPEEFERLQAMIEVSDNDSAQEIWDEMGGFDAMQAYLISIGMKPLSEPPPEELDVEDEQGAWGDASQTASQMSLFLARLWEGELLNSMNTQLAGLLLSKIVEAQAWGVTAGVDQVDRGAAVQFKNGWYPKDDGYWRINTAGIVVPGNGTQPYVVVIFGQGFDTWEGGIDTMNAVAGLLNQVMLS